MPFGMIDLWLGLMIGFWPRLTIGFFPILMIGFFPNVMDPVMPACRCRGPAVIGAMPIEVSRAIMLARFGPGLAGRRSFRCCSQYRHKHNKYRDTHRSLRSKSALLNEIESPRLALAHFKAKFRSRQGGLAAQRRTRG